MPCDWLAAWYCDHACFTGMMFKNKSIPSMDTSPIHSNIINDQQRQVLNMLSVMFSFAGFLFFFLNVRRGAIALAYIELTMSAVSLWIFFKLKEITDYKTFQKIAFVYLFLFYGVMGFAFCQTLASATVSVWIAVIPVLSYVLLGRRLGFWMTVSFVTLNFSLFVLSSRHNVFVTQPIALANIIICIIILWYTAHVYDRGNEKIKTQLANMAAHDTLTGLYNRHAFDNFFEQHLANQPLCMVVLDIDWFKTINDKYGHEAGDKALQIVADKIQQGFKKKKITDATNYVFRIGGEEFSVLLPDEPMQRCIARVQKMLDTIEQSDIVVGEGQVIRVTLSAGIAAYPDECSNFVELQRLADKRLYEAKQSGRNCLIAG